VIERHSPQSVAHSAAIRTPLTASSSCWATFVAVEQEHGVADVLLVDLDDLELWQQQLGQRHRRVLDLEPVSQRDLVAHPEHVREEVDLAAMVLVEYSPRSCACIALKETCG
jgi:hypothetical protein